MTQRSYVLVTGASSGIGREVAVALSATRNVVLHGRNIDELRKTRNLCEGANKTVWEFDLGSDENISESLSHLMSADGIEITDFIHCAGIVKPEHFRLADSSGMNLVFSVNVFSALEIAATLLRRRVNQAALGNVVFLSSIWSLLGSSGHVVYSASKGAIDAAMRSMAMELAPRVRVNSIVLGAIETPMSAGLFGDPHRKSALEETYPLGLGLASDVASLVSFLISPEARWITGQQIVLDGGRSVHGSLPPSRRVSEG